ncbi:MAG TPA: metallophosphoesterase [Armatimonadota bacterium]|nr:metallophosphoesterase [Armatimonadota bacterium]
MRLLAISDLHGDLASAWAAFEAARPDALLSCGDWGDPGEVELPALERFTERVPVYTVFGNHDDLDILRQWKNPNGSPVLLPSGERRQIGGLWLAGISGIWAKSHREPFYITDEDVDEAALRVAAAGRVDLLLTHGCPSGVADLTWQNRHGGQPCFLRAFRAIQPRIYLTGHLHRAQEYRTRDGQVIRNVGQTPRGDAALITAAGDQLHVEPFHWSG